MARLGPLPPEMLDGCTGHPLPQHAGAPRGHGNGAEWPGTVPEWTNRRRRKTKPASGGPPEWTEPRRRTRVRRGADGRAQVGHREPAVAGQARVGSGSGPLGVDGGDRPRHRSRGCASPGQRVGWPGRRRADAQDLFLDRTEPAGRGRVYDVDGNATCAGARRRPGRWTCSAARAGSCISLLMKSSLRESAKHTGTICRGGPHMIGRTRKGRVVWSEAPAIVKSFPTSRANLNCVDVAHPDRDLQSGQPQGKAGRNMETIIGFVAVPERRQAGP